MYRRFMISLIVMVLFTGVAVLDFKWIHEANQTFASDFLNESIALSATTYATCRLINGGVSSIQESSISISPWGIGIEYEAGQILDPINDATERLSSACVKSMALLGVQRLLLVFINRYTLVPFYVFFGLFLLALAFDKMPGLTGILGRGALFLLLARLLTPVICLIGQSVNEQYFEPRMVEELERLSAVKQIALAEFDAELPVLVAVDGGQGEGKWDALLTFFTDFKERIVLVSTAITHRAQSLSEAVQYLKANFSDVSQSLAALFVLTIEKIILQVFLLPLGLLYIFKKMMEVCAGPRFERFFVRIRACCQSH